MAKNPELLVITIRLEKSAWVDFCKRFLSFLNNNKDSKQIWAVRQFKRGNVQPFNSSVAYVDRRGQLKPFSTSLLSTKLLGK